MAEAAIGSEEEFQEETEPEIRQKRDFLAKDLKTFRALKQNEKYVKQEFNRICMNSDEEEKKQEKKNLLANTFVEKNTLIGSEMLIPDSLNSRNSK